ncbi:MAG: WbqC family protein [Saprospiraceae bacterium]|nr:WbqC family protein [Saprospiraceae bacterium]
MGQNYLFEISFLPSIYFFSVFSQKEITLEQMENYQKRSFRNKCVIASANGPLLLTIPLKKGKHEGQKIREVKIAYDEDWQKLHLSTIQTAYRNAPYYDFYIDKLHSLYQHADEYLFNFNLLLIRKIAPLLSLSTFNFTNEYVECCQGIDLRGVITPRNYHQIRMPKYNQVFEDRLGFLSNLTILDLLFCLGPESINYLKSVDLTEALKAI